jgi:hypothetical protein
MRGEKTKRWIFIPAAAVILLLNIRDRGRNQTHPQKGVYHPDELIYLLRYIREDKIGSKKPPVT